VGGVADAAREACLPVHDDHNEDVRRSQRWTVSNTVHPLGVYWPSDGSCAAEIGASQETTLPLPRETWEFDGWPSPASRTPRQIHQGRAAPPPPGRPPAGASGSPAGVLCTGEGAEGACRNSLAPSKPSSACHPVTFFFPASSVLGCS